MLEIDSVRSFPFRRMETLKTDCSFFLRTCVCECLILLVCTGVCKMLETVGGLSHFVIFFFVFQIAILCISVCKDFTPMPNKVNYRLLSQPGVWCSLLLPLSLASSITWFEAGWRLAMLSFLCMIAIKQMFHLVLDLRWSIAVNILLSLPSFFKVLESTTACVWLFIEVFAVLTLCDLLMSYLPRLCKHTFTFGECCLVIQGMLMPVCFINNYLPIHVFNSHGLIDVTSPVAVLVEPDLVPMSEMCRGIMFMLCSCAVLLVIVCCLHTSNVGVHVLYPSVGLTLVLGCCLPVTQSTVGWILGLCWQSYENKLLLVHWVICCMVALLIVYFYSSSTAESSTVVRKLFHAVALAIFVPGILFSTSLMTVASVVALMAFVMIECFRVMDIPPLGQFLDQHLSVFRDKQDQGQLLLTPIYLLAGFSFPLWLGVGDTSYGVHMKLLSGVIALGVGDTAASVGGTLLGATCWPNSHKTVEGTLCAMICQLFVCAIAMTIGVHYNSFVSVAMATILTSLLEAFTTQIDNLVLPFVMYALLAAF